MSEIKILTKIDRNFPKDVVRLFYINNNHYMPLIVKNFNRRPCEHHSPIISGNRFELDSDLNGMDLSTLQILMDEENKNFIFDSTFPVDLNPIVSQLLENYSMANVSATRDSDENSDARIITMTNKGKKKYIEKKSKFIIWVPWI